MAATTQRARLTLFIVPIMYVWLAPDRLAEPRKIGADRTRGNDGDGQSNRPGGPAPRPAR